MSCSRMTLLDLTQDQAHEAISKAPKTIVIRARKSNIYASSTSIRVEFFFVETRKTYRAVLSEPTLVIPQASMQVVGASDQEPTNLMEMVEQNSLTHPSGAASAISTQSLKRPRDDNEDSDENMEGDDTSATTAVPAPTLPQVQPSSGQKLPLSGSAGNMQQPTNTNPDFSSGQLKKKKRKKNKGKGDSA